MEGGGWGGDGVVVGGGVRVRMRVRAVGFEASRAERGCVSGGGE